MKAVGAGLRNQFAGHAYDAQVALEKAVSAGAEKPSPARLSFA